MSGEIIAILGVGIGLAGLILTSVRGLRQDIQTQIGELRGEINAVRSQLSAELAQLRGEIAELRDDFGKLRERMAHLEGLLEGIRDFVTGRATS